MVLGSGVFRSGMVFDGGWCGMVFDSGWCGVILDSGGGAVVIFSCGGRSVLVLDGGRSVERVASTGGELTVARRGQTGSGGEAGGEGRVAAQAGGVVQQSRGRPSGGVVPEGVAHYVDPAGGC